MNIEKKIRGEFMAKRKSTTLGRSRIHFEDSHFNISLVTATSTRIQSEDVLHGAHVGWREGGPES
jgi:hypothetical protein